MLKQPLFSKEFEITKCIVIFSGGQDSATCLGLAMKEYDEVVAISFNYGQKHTIELDQAKKITNLFEIEHHFIDISFLNQIVDSALVHSNGNVNTNHNRLQHLPASFVPNRNGLFITLAHSFAQKIGANTLITGVCETDYSGYPDCRNDFIRGIENTLNLGSNTDIQIVTPLMYLNKAQTFQLAKDTGILDVVIEYTHTCYNGVRDIKYSWGYGCDDCPACVLRKKGYQEFIRKNTNV